MSQTYRLATFAVSPVTLVDMKSFLKVTSASDDILIQLLIDSATEWGEKYTGREFRANTWELLIDAFTDRICVRRDPIDTIDQVTRLVLGTPTAVASSVYFLKENTQWDEILLQEDQEWPTDVDEREQAIQIDFTTKAYVCINEIKNAIMLHVAHLYTNRGDCDDASEAASKSGATMLYNQFRISRV